MSKRIKSISRTKSPGGLFSPSTFDGGVGSAGVTRPVSLSTLSETNILSTASFRYDNPGTGLKSTQELNVDWSKFENHTFFNSAEAKVNVAFDRIINEYPFDGTGEEIEAFEDGLTGYERYVLSEFPTHAGFLIFSGTKKGEDPANGYGTGLGTTVNVIDSAGSLFPQFSRRKDGGTVIDPGELGFVTELHLFVPKQRNHNQIICQKLIDHTKGITLAISESKSPKSCNVVFSINSGSAALFVTASIEKGYFSHIAAMYDKSTSTNNLKLFVSQSLVATSRGSWDMTNLTFEKSSFKIGTGSSFFTSKDSQVSGETLFTPNQTLSGAIDEFRFWHRGRTVEQISDFSKTNIFAQPNLALYLKFDEPSGSFGIDNVVLDSSGNSLHSFVNNYTNSLRLTETIGDIPLTAQDKEYSPILFPRHERVQDLNTKLLVSSSLYDDRNPNLITKLIPVHYLLEGQAEEGLQTQDGTIGDGYTGPSMPGSGQLGSAQLMTMFLLVWAKYFDEVKMFIDHFSNLLSVDYDEEESVCNKFLPFVAKYYGIELPNLYSDSDPIQYIQGHNIGSTYSKAAHSLFFVQNEIWRRILINLREIINSKGTQHSIRSIFRAAGIDPDNIVNIREYGGPTSANLDNKRIKRSEVNSILDFSGSIARNKAKNANSQGQFSNFPNVMSPFLSSSRVEVGKPQPTNTAFVSKNSEKYYPHGTSPDPSDGLFTSGSFTFEGSYKFPPSRDYKGSQSLMRMHVSGWAAPSSKHGLVANMIVMSGAQNSITSSGSEIRLYLRPSWQASSKYTTLILSGVDIFDGNIWNLSFGRYRNDFVRSYSSSSYFLRAARQSFGEIKNLYITSSFYQEGREQGGNPPHLFNVFSNVNTNQGFNTSGSFLAVGSQSFDTTARFLNDTTITSLSRVTTFGGLAGQFRFWSKGLTVKEWKEHVRYPKSLGIDNPNVNYNFFTISTGSFERMRVDVSTDQAITESNTSGEIVIMDFSQNGLDFKGTGFEKNKRIIRPQTLYFEMLSPHFDLAQSDSKVRVRSFDSPAKLEESTIATEAPVFEVLESETPDDDTRFSIEMSAVKALNEDIMTLFSSFDFFNDALGRTNILFDEFYPDLDQLRKIYFQRLTDKLNIQMFFDVFRWFDTSLSDLLEQMIPRTTKFMGLNFVIESHTLERARYRYLHQDIYLSSDTRLGTGGTTSPATSMAPSGKAFLGVIHKFTPPSGFMTPSLPFTSADLGLGTHGYGTLGSTVPPHGFAMHDSEMAGGTTAVVDFVTRYNPYEPQF